MDGVLVVDKPPGLTSHDVVVRVRRALGVRRVGHIGTLDPMATGVLPLVVGRATRLATLLAVGHKVYEGAVLLGVATDTYDVTGTVTADARDQAGTGPVRAPSRPEVERVAEAFVGTFTQRPPPFSAKKIGGVRAYRLARRRQPVNPTPVEVTVHALDILDVTASHIRCRVSCEPGFYMRALAHDLGAALGCGACLESLRRERSGAFDLDQAVTLDELEGAQADDLSSRMSPLAHLLPDVPRLVMTEHGTKRASHGNDVSQADVLSSDRGWSTGPVRGGGTESPMHPRNLVRLCDQHGTLIAIAKADEARLLHPMIVLV